MHHTQMMRLRHKLGEDAASPKYIFSEPSVRYRMPQGIRREVAVVELFGAITSFPCEV